MIRPDGREGKRWADSGRRGLWPFSVANHIHVLPPCTATREEAEDGLGILDEAREVADRYAMVDGHRGG